METIEKIGPEYLLMVLKKDSTTEVDVRDNDELIAKLEVEKHEYTDSNEILFYETSFRITTHDPVDSHGTQPTGSAKSQNTPGTEIYKDTEGDNPRLRNITFDTSGTAPEPDIAKRVKCLRSSSTSDYTSQCSFRFSNDTQFSCQSESDPTMDLDGDLTN